MTPHEYLKIEAEQKAIISAARAIISRARAEADKASPPDCTLRPARADDIKPGVVVWHSREAKYGGWYWHVIDKPQHYGDSFRAYIADDGGSYGLDGAWVYNVCGQTSGGTPSAEADCSAKEV